ncbi:MAG TPA: Eco57I restriction-modification methylase domain-containing protein, partial [Candidatus Kapabacteria bacterium]|nr:Eco57I restriction-modification methylase domain-containing protein [Candidatus Kapabacteria bacterium]
MNTSTGLIMREKVNAVLPSITALPPIEKTNKRFINTPDKNRQRELGQFLTPPPIADFMASLFEARWSEVKLLDAGAGTGTLSAALIKRLCHQTIKPKSISLTAYEIDASLIGGLYRSILYCREECSRAGIMFTENVFNEDFIKAAIPITEKNLFSTSPQRFNAVIVNPPYRKINSNSSARLLLRSLGIETSNLYSGFLALLSRLVADKGEMVAITPRSFCNGPYFKSFREEFLEKMSLRRLHVFELRSAAFKNDNVLQENVILHAVKSTIKPDKIIISTSSGEPCEKIKERECFYHDVVSPQDPGMFIHLITDDIQDKVRKRISKFSASLTDLGLEVSTGKVVDFRAGEFLRPLPEKETVPLIYPCHFNKGYIQWPRLNGKKPNAIINNTLTKDLLVPEGIYV